MSGPPKKSSAVRVLVVDDYRPITQFLVTTWCEEGYDARAAFSAAEALAVMEIWEPHAVIADAMLPDSDGWTLGAEMERRCPGCKVLLMSAAVHMHHPPQGAPRYRIVPKAEVMDEFPEFLGSE